MSIEERIPSMSEKELQNLQDNALRLAEGGTVKQKDDAARILPLVSAALEERTATRAAEREETRRVAKATAAERKPAKKAKAKA